MNDPASRSEDAARIFQRIGGEQFIQETWERNWRVFPGALDISDLSRLISLADLDRLVLLGGLPSSDIQMIEAGRARAVPLTPSVAPALDSRYLFDAYRRGTSFRIQHLENHLAEVASFCRGMLATFGHVTRANLYAAPPQSTGLHPHYDTSEAFIFQIVGSKHWKIYSSYTNMISAPLPENVFDASRHRPIGEPVHLELNRGDVLYLPRGIMHSAFTAQTPSVHLTFSVLGLTWTDLLNRFLRNQAAENVELRKLVPLYHSDKRLAEEAARIWRSVELGELLSQTLLHCKAHVAAEKPDIDLGSLAKCWEEKV